MQRKKLKWESFPEEPEYIYEKRVREQFNCSARIEYVENPSAFVCLDELEASYFIKYSDGTTEESESFALSCFKDYRYTCKRGYSFRRFQNGTNENITVQNVYVKISGLITPLSGNGTTVRFAELYRISESFLPEISVLIRENLLSVEPMSCNYSIIEPDYSLIASICGRYNLPKEDNKVSIQVLNINGQIVATILPPTVQKIGEQTMTYNTSDLANGVYMVRVVADESSKVTKMGVAH